MPYKTRRITPNDLMAPHEYSRVRAQRRQELESTKTLRRIQVGPFITFYFESYDTIWFQIQEMLHIEGGGLAQIPGELEAYNPLIPQGRELVATVMLEIGEPIRRAKVLGVLGGIENTAFILVQGEIINGIPEIDLNRTKSDGKTSSVHFLHFPFTREQIGSFCNFKNKVVIGFSHPDYSHMTVVSGAVQLSLSKDFAAMS